ncbi:MAG: hypothetical protein AAF192_20155, partial [Pseudomonadota bacterium]
DADLVRGLPADFGALLTGNGWQRLPSGLILQWGNASTADAGAAGLLTLALPIAFPTAMLSAVVSDKAGSGTSGQAHILSWIEGDSSASTLAVMSTQGPSDTLGNSLFSFIALGH